MGMACRNGQTAINMMDSGSKEKPRVTVNFTTRMEIFTKDSFKMISRMAKAPTSILMELNILENGSIMCNLAREPTGGPMVIPTRASLEVVRRLAKENSHGKIRVTIVEHGWRT